MLVNLNDVLKDAQKKKYAVGLFNTIDTDMLQAAIEAAEENRSPIIIGTAEVLLPYGELKLIAPALVEAARNAKVPVVVNFDHGLSFSRCLEAMKLGFSSVMFDGSAGDYETNIADTRQIVKVAHSFGATVEGEIGHVGQTESCDNDATDMYTTPDEAMSFLDATGVDALAIAIGTAHGVYKSKPKLDIERLKAIRAKTDTPLVLHGGSGLSDEDFKKVISEGIAKINIFTDMAHAAVSAMKDGTEKGLSFHKIRNLKKEYIKETVKTKIKLFGSNGRY
jgi:fructose-bisphosphate aldolase class II